MLIFPTMNNTKKLINKTEELKRTKAFYSLKLDFESEFYSSKDLSFIKKLSEKFDFELTVKLGGCQSVQNIIEAKNIGINKFVAPMIESEYALSKYVEIIQNLPFNKKPRLFINIETIQAFHNIDAILNSQHIEFIEGLVIGRSDLAKSMGLEKQQVNSQSIFNIVQEIINKAKNKNLYCTVGGNLDMHSIDFLNNLKGLDFFETRKVIFKYDQNILLNDSINQALDFELLWLEYKNTELSKSRKKELLSRLS